MNSLCPILLAEDNPHDLELTLTALRESKLANEIVTVPDGAEALDYLFRRDRFAARPDRAPCVVLLDLKMPKVDGLEVLRQVRASPQFRRLPIVVLTSSREESDLIKSYELGVNSYVVKPVDFEEFMVSVRQIGCFWALVNEPPTATTAECRMMTAETSPPAMNAE